MKTDKQTYGVIGAGSFGTVMANIIAENANVLVYTRRKHIADSINEQHHHPSSGTDMHPNVRAIMDLQQLCEQTTVIFPVVRSSDFRQVMKQAAPYLRPDHILIHGTKGLNLKLPAPLTSYEPGEGLRRSYIKTMSDIIREESVVIRIGCISGPNLARELTQGQPAATVVASRFEEVIEQGKNALRNDKFRVYSSHDLLGVELAGVLKNIIAIASGMLSGLELGENTRALLLTRGLGEMVKLGRALGAEAASFLGLAGVGDLIATCSSTLSRNYTVGRRLAQGETLTEIIADMEEVAEGVNTVKIAKGLSVFYNISTPIVEALYQILYCNQSIQEQMHILMTHPFDTDADFIVS